MTNLGQSIPSPRCHQPGEPQIAVGRKVGRRILPERCGHEDQSSGLPPSRREVEMIDRPVAHNLHRDEQRVHEEQERCPEHGRQTGQSVPGKDLRRSLSGELSISRDSEPPNDPADTEKHRSPGQHRTDRDGPQRTQCFQTQSAARPEDHGGGQDGGQPTRLQQPIRAIQKEPRSSTPLTANACSPVPMAVQIESATTALQSSHKRNRNKTSRLVSAGNGVSLGPSYRTTRQETIPSRRHGLALRPSKKVATLCCHLTEQLGVSHPCPGESISRGPSDRSRRNR